MARDFATTFASRARAARDRFIRSLERGKALQLELLERFVRDNAATAFGREHGFASVKTEADYRRAVPIRTFDELQPWVQRQLDGERAVLSAAAPVLYFSTTGTTGKPKHVPVTREFLNRWGENLLVFWANVVDRFPAVLERDDSVVMLHLAPKPFSRFAAGGIPIHVSTEMPVLVNGAFPFSRAPWFPPPPELSDAERLYYLLRAAAESPLVGIACLHSSRLQAAVAMLEREGERLVREVHDGTMRGASWREPNPQRAAELAALLREGSLVPSRVWPTLAFVSTWIGASFELYRPQIERDFTSAIIPQMTVSSEVGHMTMPLGADTADGPLTVNTNYYEFRTADDERTLSFDELEEGAVYEIIVTTCAGLYRYCCGDQFRVAERVHGVPRLDFVGRAGVSDLAGEKLTEQHVNEALNGAVAAEGLRVASATICATWGQPARYVAIVEPATPWSADAQARFAAALEGALRRLAPRYDLKRGFGDLGSLELRVCPRGTFDRHRAARVQRGIPGTQLKDKVLHFHYESDVLDALDAAAKRSAP